MMVFVQVMGSRERPGSGPRGVQVRPGETPQEAATRFLVEAWGYSPGFDWVPQPANPNCPQQRVYDFCRDGVATSPAIILQAQADE